MSTPARAFRAVAPLLLALPGCTGCPSVFPPPPPPQLPTMTGPITIEPRSAPRPTLGLDPDAATSAFEGLALDAFNRGRASLGRPDAAYDPVLGDVAAAHARLILQHGEAASEAAVDDLLAWAGAVDPHPQRHVLITTGGDDIELLAHVERLAGEERHELAGLVVGFGRHAQQGRTVLMTVVSDRSFILDQTPRTVPSGQPLVLTGRLAPGFHGAELLFLSDGEKILHVPPTERGLSSRGERVTFRFAPPQRGQVLAEILLTGPRGPTVGALFPLSVGEDPPSSFVLRPAPDESSIRSSGDAEERMIELINTERVLRHLPALMRNEAATGAARAFAQSSMRSGILAHVGEDGGRASDRLAAVGISAARVAENLARNATLEDAHRSLMRSLGHRQNILDRAVDQIAVGVATDPALIDGVREREFWVVCEFFRRVPRVDPVADARTLRASINAARHNVDLPRLKADDDLDMLAAKLAGKVMQSRNVEPPGLGAMLDEAMSQAAERWKAWALQVYRVALPLDEATDPAGALQARYTHVGIGLAQPSFRLAPDDVRTSVVFILAARRQP